MKDILQSFSALVGVPVNLLLIGILAVVLAIVLTRLGKRTSAALVFAAYPAFLLFLVFPFQARLAEMIGRGDDFLLAAVVLALFYLASYFVIVRFFEWARSPLGCRFIYGSGAYRLCPRVSVFCCLISHTGDKRSTLFCVFS